MAILLATPKTEFVELSTQLWQVSVERYHEMIRAGSLTENDRLELLEGYLVEKMTVKPPHAYTTETIRELLGKLIPENMFISSQQPVTLADSEPEPDIMVVSGNRRQFVDRHPGPEDAALIIEVADSTVQQDRNWKKRIYARAGIAIYWVVNLLERQIEVYTQPSGPTSSPTYYQLNTYRQGDEIPVVLAGEEIASLPVNELLP